MILQEPKVEFVALNMSESIATSTGGGQRCVASQVDAHYCDSWDDDIPWQNGN